MRLTIHEGTSFAISVRLGNFPKGTELGFFHQDTRYLSCYDLTLDGRHPVPLLARATPPHSAAYFLTNPALKGVARGSLSLTRTRALSAGCLRERLELANYGDGEAVLTLGLTVDADFAHLFGVKRSVEALSRGIRRSGNFWLVTGTERYGLYFRFQRGQLLRRLAVHLSRQPTRIARGNCQFQFQLAPRER
jgi:hypothetical protein